MPVRGCSISRFVINFCAKSLALLFAAMLAAIIWCGPFAHAQTLSVLHTFSGRGDGGEPLAGVTLDRAGNLYGTTLAGNVFKLTHFSGGWGLTNLHTFQGRDDGAMPQARVLFGPDGTLFGTTTNGGTNDGGTVFNLRPPATFCRTIQCPWGETVIYRFTGGDDGGSPQYGDLAFDAAGNVYGTTSYGGSASCGVVFKLSRSGGQWTESVLYTFPGGTGGCLPYSGVAFDLAGNLYGTTTQGGSNGTGVVYELTPSGSGWTETTLHNFGGQGDGYLPYGGVILDGQGNIYGTTFEGPDQYAGTVYELQPSGGGWTYSVLHTFNNGSQGSFAALTMDAAGNLYGTTFGDGGVGGNVFKLTPGTHGWTYTDLHDFNGNDGIEPAGGVTLDSSGNIYGTTFYDMGEVFKITP